MLLKTLKRLIILSAIIRFTSCEESDSKSSDATSRIRFVQYQSSSARENEQQPNADNSVPVTSEQEGKSSKISTDVIREFNRRQDQLSHNDDKAPSLVPKNYAFAYAIRDRNSGDDFSHTQAHNGQATKGQYRVKLPDGRVQVVTYTADNGGYRADIHYDKGNTIYEGQADNSLAYLHRSAEKPLTTPKELAEKNNSPLLYFNEMRSFGVSTTGRPPTSYETHEHVDEGRIVYDKTLVDDVNYLLKYVAPTIESRTENVFDITPDNLHKRQQLLNANNNNNDRLGRFKFELPVDFPFQGPSLDAKKYSAGYEESTNTAKLKLNRSQYGAPRVAVFRASNPPKQDASVNGYRRPQILLPLRIQPQNVATKYELQEQPRFANSKYDSRDPSQFRNSNSPYLNTETETETRPYVPRYESQEQSPKYDPQTLAQIVNAPRESLSSPRPIPAKYNSQEQSKYSPNSHESSQSRTAKYGGSRESATLNLKTDTRLFPSKNEISGTTSSRYTPKAELQDQIQPPKYNLRALYVTTPRYQTEKESSAEVNSAGKYESGQALPELVLKFENREQSPFHTPKLDPQKFRPSQPFVPRSEEKPLFMPHSSYRSQYDTSSRLSSNPPSTQKYQQYEEINYSGPSDGASIEFPQGKYTGSGVSQENPPVSPVPNFNSQEHPPVAPVPRYNSKEAPVSPGSVPYGYDDSPPTTPTIPIFVTNTDERKPNGAQFGKIEIPQYLHIHRYESGEDAKPKELIYYTPLQIPIPNSVAYMERGNLSDSKNSQFATLTPAYHTMTEHPHLSGEENLQYPKGLPLYDSTHFELPANLTSMLNLRESQEAPLNQPETESPNYRPHINDLRYVTRPTYSFDDRPLKSPIQHQSPRTPQVTTEVFSEEHHGGSFENADDMGYFDPRTYSGYFDFMPSTEVQEEKPVAENGREPEPNQEMSPPSSQAQPPVPQYLYNYATATPSHRYISSEAGSREGNMAGTPVTLSDSGDPLRNSSFRAAAYLRPLHKERVYIHHNSQPTTPSDDHFSGIASTTRMHKKTADISIVKSISSTIPPDLLKDFDYQLAASIFHDTLHEGSELNVRSTLPTTISKLDKSIVKKLQTALSTNGKIYLKSPTRHERTVS